MKDVMFVFGTRPEVIKLAPVISAVEESPELSPIICASGQHREMMDQMLEIFALNPDYDLAVMEEDQSLVGLNSRLLEGIDEVFGAENPDLTLVQGDTTTCLAGALVSYYRRVPLGHLEAGLRSGDKFDPFPEEINRILTDRLSDIFFPPTEENKSNLEEEGLGGGSIYVTGNTVVDALFRVRDIVEDNSKKLDLPFAERIEKEQRLILITAHRRESFGKGLEGICRAVKELADIYPDAFFVYPVHLNPNVRKKVKTILGGSKNVLLTEPLDYPEFVWLMDRAELILTDSGGVQEEAPSLDTPVLVTRKKTERKEALEAGTVELVGVDSEDIVERTKNYLSNTDLMESMKKKKNPYGDGRASERIVKGLVEFLSKSEESKTERA